MGMKQYGSKRLIFNCQYNIQMFTTEIIKHTADKFGAIET